MSINQSKELDLMLARANKRIKSFRSMLDSKHLKNSEKQEGRELVETYSLLMTKLSKEDKKEGYNETISRALTIERKLSNLHKSTRLL